MTLASCCCSGLVLVGISSCSSLCDAKVSTAPGSVLLLIKTASFFKIPKQSWKNDPPVLVSSVTYSCPQRTVAIKSQANETINCPRWFVKHNFKYYIHVITSKRPFWRKPWCLTFSHILDCCHFYRNVYFPGLLDLKRALYLFSNLLWCLCEPKQNKKELKSSTNSTFNSDTSWWNSGSQHVAVSYDCPATQRSTVRSPHVKCLWPDTNMQMI